jgi:hypothetical protein
MEVWESQREVVHRRQNGERLPGGTGKVFIVGNEQGRMAASTRASSSSEMAQPWRSERMTW